MGGHYAIATITLNFMLNLLKWYLFLSFSLDNDNNDGDGNNNNVGEFTILQFD